jgi:glycosyltransferase involved in cell wall biosynthesis|tara:strand:- start:73 stop:1932 length:1860 start_codon:yes stop_codon:yes gene_type:complete
MNISKKELQNLFGKKLRKSELLRRQSETNLKEKETELFDALDDFRIEKISYIDQLENQSNEIESLNIEKGSLNIEKGSLNSKMESLNIELESFKSSFREYSLSAEKEKSRCAKQLELTRNSISYRLGNALVQPIVLFKKLILNSTPSKSIQSESLKFQKIEEKNTKYKITKITNLSKELVFEKLAKEGFSLNVKHEHKYEPSNAIVYLCHMSLPINSAGYATRTQYLLSTLIDSGLKMLPVSRLGYPYDLNKTSKKAKDLWGEDWKAKQTHDVKNVEYNILKFDNYKWNNLNLDDYIRAYSDAIIEFALIHKPCAIHAASDFRNGLAAALASKKLGIPFIYEVRGLWEITSASKNADFKTSSEFKAIKRLETLACQAADHIFTLTMGLKEELVNRGVDVNKIHLLPNAIDSSTLPTLVNKDVGFMNELKIENNEVIIGYIGSFVAYEGLDDLIRACAELINIGHNNFKLLLIGDGKVMPELKQLVLELDLNNKVIFTGRVLHEEVPKYYSLIDIAPFPRKPVEVCEMVSPLKPLEALAMEKAVLVSSVAAQKEMIIDNETGLIFNKGEISDLISKLSTLINDKDLRKTLGKNGKVWVTTNRSWKGVVQDYVSTISQYSN